MFDPKSDYAMNKFDPDAIVCKSASGVHIRLTRKDFASEDEFQRWKTISDEDYRKRECAEHIQSKNTLSLTGLSDAVTAVASPETLSSLNKSIQKHNKLNGLSTLHKAPLPLKNGAVFLSVLWSP